MGDSRIVIEEDLTEKDVLKRYKILEKGVTTYTDTSAVGDIVVAIEWYEGIDAMRLKLEDKIYGAWFYLSKNTKLKELK